jgi:hypothetical protein
MGLFDIGDRDPSAQSERGCCFWLSDTRLDATGPERVFTSRLVQQVTGSDGLQSAASFEAAFNPSYERLVIHGIRVWREGAVREAYETVRFQMEQKRRKLTDKLLAVMTFNEFVLFAQTQLGPQRSEAVA